MNKKLPNIPSELSEYIKNYYRSNQVDLDFISNVKFRHFRFRLSNGSFYKVKRKFHDAEDLRDALLEYEPIDVYYSTSCWLNPHLIASKLDKDILKNVFLSCDLSFDIDVNKDVIKLEDARVNAVKLCDFLSLRNIPIRYIAFSGSKGFHVVCDDPWKDLCIDLDPRKRESLAVEKRKIIIRDIKESGIKLDDKVTIDTRRIIRVPNTINSKTGNLCTAISRSLLESDLETILKSVKTNESNTPRILQLVREMTSPSAYKISGLLGRLGVRPRPKPLVHYSTFISNNIPGTRLKVPIMEFGIWSKFETIISNILKAQKLHSLGDVAIFKDNSRYWAISIKAVSQRRIEKILYTAESINLNQCQKYGCTYMRIGKSIGYDGKTLQDEPFLVKILESNLNGQASKTHYELLSSLGVSFSEDKFVLCGKGKESLEMIHTIIE